MKFINTCDSMIHARMEGETFGLAIGEFSYLNKPVITTISNIDNAHINLLGEKAILYNSKESLINILLTFEKNNYLNRDLNAYKEYTPEKVMKQFFSVFNIKTNIKTNIETNIYNSMLENPTIKNSFNEKITIVTAFYDIGRGNWGIMKRSVEYYINSFKNYLSLEYEMVVFIDDRYISSIITYLSKNITIIPIHADFLENNIESWKNIEKDLLIMNSENYKKMLVNRIHNGHPENIFPEYNCINHAKIDFIKYALPFIKTSFVCWSDFGYHSSILNNNSSIFPTDILDINLFNTSKINVCLMNKIKEYDSISILQNAPNIFTGSFYGLPVNLVNPFHELYHYCLNELYLLNISDDDQHILLKCYYKRPELFELYLSEGKWPEALTYFQKRNKEHLKYLEVYEYPKLIRLGSLNDGGYVIGEGFEYDCYISAGVAGEESFSRDFINNYNTLVNYAFDGTIDYYPWQYTTKIMFYKQNINNFSDQNNTDLLKFIEKYDNIFLKMDIEGGEYPWISKLNRNNLLKFKQIVIEFHGINDDSWGFNYLTKLECFKKLQETHYLIHAHGNNCSGTTDKIPDVIELTYINKINVDVLKKNMRSLPIKGLDSNNHIFIPDDLDMNFYPFVFS